MKTSESISEISAALCKFQGIVENPKKDAENPHFKSKYADLDEIITTIRPALEKSDLAFIQNPVVDEKGNVGVYTLLLHKSGEYIQFDPVFIPIQKAGPHQIGSAMTYARRYSLGTALGLATEEDEDGNNAQSTDQKPKAYQRYLAIAKKKRFSKKQLELLIWGAYRTTQLNEAKYKFLADYLEQVEPEKFERTIECFQSIKDRGLDKNQQKAVFVNTTRKPDWRKYTMEDLDKIIQLLGSTTKEQLDEIINGAA